VAGGQDTTTTALDVVISRDNDWQLDSMSFNFSAAVNRTYTADIINGRQVVENLNDSLWMSCENNSISKLTLDPGFYTGTQLGYALALLMDAAFGGSATIFYNNVTGIYRVSTTAGNLRYLNIYTATTMDNSDSIAGHLFGFDTTTTAYQGLITSDTAVPSLDMSSSIIDNTNAELSHYHDTIHTLDIDQALNITSSVAALNVNYVVVLEDMV